MIFIQTPGVIGDILRGSGELEKMGIHGGSKNPFLFVPGLESDLEGYGGTWDWTDNGRAHLYIWLSLASVQQSSESDLGSTVRTGHCSLWNIRSCYQEVDNISCLKDILYD